MRRKAYVVDYGIINLKNIVRGLEKVNADVEICTHPRQLEKASNIIVPGVGAFKIGMEEIKRRGFDEGLTRAVEKGLPMLGICLGMQLFMQESFEHGQSLGLGFISGSVEQIPTVTRHGQKRKVPHIGWGKILIREPFSKHIFLKGLTEKAYFYFVHSYYVEPLDKKIILSNTQYGNLKYCSALRYKNITAFQFHPEKSGPSGIKIYLTLKNSLSNV